MKKYLRIAAILFVLAIITVTILFFFVGRPPLEIQRDKNVISDVTQMNVIQTDSILHPITTEQISNAVRNHKEQISIGGARHSMGGQIGSDHSLHIDMRTFDKVLFFSKEERTITVQSGITWRKIQEYIDPHDLSVKIMQTYANFTVGGSLSVNVHGRYIGQGPIIKSVQSIRVVLADGTDIPASPHENTEIFYGCIGGYGGLGLITEVTLSLTDNVKLERFDEVMKFSDYTQFFKSKIRNDSSVIFHNADIYPDDYEFVRAISFIKTDKPVTEESRLRPWGNDYRAERFAMWAASEMPSGKWLREHVGDPLYHRSGVVRWRNYEASYDANELEPHSRENSTYVLQEYFVPVDSLNSFIPKMAKIFQRHQANVLNVSIRHAHQDPGSLLAWAKSEVFCFVVYYKQGTTQSDVDEVRNWTRELIDVAISTNGSYYLPYQIHATDEQFHKAYPGAKDFFALKKKLDPTNKFTNKLWNTYYRP